MRGLCQQMLEPGTPVLAITAPVLAHVYLNSQLSGDQMEQLRTLSEYGSVLDRLEANAVQGIIRGIVTTCQPQDTVSIGGGFEAEVELRDEAPVCEIGSLVSETIERLNAGGDFPFDPDDFNVAKMTCGPNALSRERKWEQVIRIDSKVVTELQRLDDPVVLSMHNPDLCDFFCDLLPINQDDPVLVEAKEKGDQDAIDARIREVWPQLPMYQPIALLVPDTIANHQLLHGIFKTVQMSLRSRTREYPR